MQISRDKVKAYREDLADQYYKKKISWEEYNKKWDEIKILPYDLSKFPTLSESSIKWINKLFIDGPEVSKRGNFMLRGFTRYEATEMRVLGLTYGDYADAISFYAYNDEEMIMYEFTEGDTVLQLFPTREEYEAEKEATRQWYKEERCA